MKNKVKSVSINVRIFIAFIVIAVISNATYELFHTTQFMHKAYGVVPIFVGCQLLIYPGAHLILGIWYILEKYGYLEHMLVTDEAKPGNLEVLFLYYVKLLFGKLKQHLADAKEYKSLAIFAVFVWWVLATGISFCMYLILTLLLH